MYDHAQGFVGMGNRSRYADLRAFQVGCYPELLGRLGADVFAAEAESDQSRGNSSEQRNRTQ